MRIKTILLVCGLIILFALPWFSAGYAAEMAPYETGEKFTPQQPDGGPPYITPMIHYRGKLLEGGTPVNGTRSLSFALFSSQSGGTAVWQEGPDLISVVDGLFSAALGDINPLPLNEFDQELWLEVQVSGSPLARQRLMGSPYAMSLAPGAQITGARPVGASAALGARNTGSGQGIRVLGTGVGRDGAVLYSENTGGGVAAWTRNYSSDANLVLENLGSGHLIKGFGGDGGEEEFYVSNNGDIYYEGSLTGAFPRPAWTSGFLSYSKSEQKTLTHSLGGNVDDYYVYMTCKQGGYYLINNFFIGQENDDSGNQFGAFYWDLNTTSVKAMRSMDDTSCEQLKISIWVIK